MEIILNQNVKGLGAKHDVVDVKPGYARNFLIPQGFAIIANESNKKIIAETQRQQARKLAKVKEDAQAIATKLEGMRIVIKTKAGESGKIFGSVTPLQIADAIKDRGIDVDRKIIDIDQDIKMLGEYTATLDLHKEVKPQIAIIVEEE
ncbi:MAG: 50S ribosomal protein L9 [Bernardetiaceae bacterium]|nr:50S ribosomal protein L9 [Bernardetiaceae bacterium]